jgi:hypothetical protein
VKLTTHLQLVPFQGHFIIIIVVVVIIMSADANKLERI